MAKSKVAVALEWKSYLKYRFLPYKRAMVDIEGEPEYERFIKKHKEYKIDDGLYPQLGIQFANKVLDSGVLSVQEAFEMYLVEFVESKRHFWDEIDVAYERIDNDIAMIRLMITRGALVTRGVLDIIMDSVEVDEYELDDDCCHAIPALLLHLFFNEHVLQSEELNEYVKERFGVMWNDVVPIERGSKGLSIQSLKEQYIHMLTNYSFAEQTFTVVKYIQYKGRQYEVYTGRRGGKYVLVEGKKRYLSKCK